MIRLLLSKTILPIELSVVRSIHKVNLPPIELRLKCFSSTSINSSYAASDSNLLAKDVIVYKYDNPRYFKYLSLFIYSQFIFWGKNRTLLFSDFTQIHRNVKFAN